MTAYADHLRTMPPYAPMAWEKPSYVYFIGGLAGPVKIGVAIDPKRRLHQIQVSSPRRLALLAAVPGAFEQERYFHAALKRERLSGEWFRRSRRLREIVDDLSAQWSAQSVQEMFA